MDQALRPVQEVAMLVPYIENIVENTKPVYNGVVRKPYKHQIDALYFFKDMKEAMLLWEMGTGKTGGALMLTRMRCVQEARFLKILIISPSITLGNWQDEIKQWTPIKDKDVLCLIKGTGKKKAEQVREVGDTPKVIIVNYEALLNDDLFKAVQAWGPELVIGDEIHYCKTHNTQRSKKVALLADKAKYKIFLTGTPILNSVKDIFMPYRIMDRGATFGSNIQVFMNKYMVDENAGWKASGGTGYFPKWKNNPATFDELTEKIYTKAIRKRKAECLDLPPLLEEVALVDMTKEQWKAYEEMRKNLVTFIQNEKKNGILSASVASIALVKALRLMQIASGYIRTEDGEVIYFKENPKLEYLKEFLEQVTPDHKVLIGCNFEPEYEMLEKVCKELGIKYVMLTGNESMQEKSDNVRAFQTDSLVRVVIANRGCIGVNLTAASYICNFSRDFNLGKELQFTARSHRGGSEIHDKITKVDLACRDTIDIVALAGLTSKDDVAKRIIDIFTGK